MFLQLIDREQWNTLLLPAVGAAHLVAAAQAVFCLARLLQAKTPILLKLVPVESLVKEAPRLLGVTAITQVCLGLLLTAGVEADVKKPPGFRVVPVVEEAQAVVPDWAGQEFLVKATMEGTTPRARRLLRVAAAARAPLGVMPLHHQSEVTEAMV